MRSPTWKAAATNHRQCWHRWAEVGHKRHCWGMKAQPKQGGSRRIVVDGELLADVEQLRQAQPVPPSRAALVRRLLRRGLDGFRAETSGGSANGSGMSGVRC